MIILFFTVVMVRLSRAENVTVSVTDTRFVWSGPNRYNPECGGVNCLMENETVSLNFTGTNVTINFVMSNNASSQALISMDGGYVTTMDTYDSPDSICQLLAWPSRTLSQAQHNITVTGGDRNISRPCLFIHSFVYTSTAPTSSSAISGHASSKVAHIVGGTVGGVVCLILITAIIFLLCRRRRRSPPSSDRADSDTNEKLEMEPTTSNSESQLAFRGSNGPGEKLHGSLPGTTVPKGSGFSGVLSSSTPVQATTASNAQPILSTSSSDLQWVQNVESLSPKTPFCASPDQHISETPTPFTINIPPPDGWDEELPLSFAIENSPTGGEVPVPSRSSPASQTDMITTSPPETTFSPSTEEQLSDGPLRAMEMPSDLDDDVELPLTYAVETHPTASEEIFHPDTALIPTPTVEKLNDWTERSKVVFSIDIGTSHSAISFAYLQSQKEPVVENVSSWPGQFNDLARAQTVTAIYYDKNGEPRSYGAMVQMSEIKEKAKKEGWVLVDSFKRHINNLSDVVSTTDTRFQTDVPKLTLPDDVPIGTVYAHWIQYLFGHAVSIFIAKYTKRTWDELKQDIEVVFTVPNGWYTQEHGVLARAAVEAKIIQKPAQAKFIPETEAAVHWELWSGGLNPDIYTDFLVCNAGTSTTDIALYHVSGISPLQLQEVEGFPSQCIEAGLALITDALLNDLVGRLPMLTHDEGIPAALREVVMTAVQTLGAPEEISAANETEETFPRHKLAAQFDSEIAKIVAAIEKLNANNKPKFLLLFGDFGRNPYFQSRLRDRYEPDMQIINAGGKNIKSAAPGAIFPFLKSDEEGLIAQRAARFTFGMNIVVQYDARNPEHSGRPVIDRADGTVVPHGWDQIVAIGTLVTYKEEHKRGYYMFYDRQPESLADFKADVYIVDDEVASTNWMFDRHGVILPGFRKICTVEANISELQGRLPSRFGPTGRMYYYLDFKVAIKFGTTSPEARILWEENGREVSGKATIIPVMLA